MRTKHASSFSLFTTGSGEVKYNSIIKWHKLLRTSVILNIYACSLVRFMCLSVI